MITGAGRLSPTSLDLKERFTLMYSMERTLNAIYLSLFLFIPVYYSANASSVLELANICEPIAPTDTNTSNSPQTPLPSRTSSLPPRGTTYSDKGIQMTTVSVPDTTPSDPVLSPSEMLNGSTWPAFPSPTERQPSAFLQDAWCAYIETCLTEGKYLFSLSGIMIAYVDVPGVTSSSECPPPGFQEQP